MSEVFGINVVGDVQLRDKLAKAAESIQKEVLEKIRYGGTQIAEISALRAPYKNGHLESSVFKHDLPEGCEVGFTADYAPYVEFGTGIYAASGGIPAGLEEFAYQFFVSGKGLMHPQPFFFPTVREVTADLIIKVQTIIDSLK